MDHTIVHFEIPANDPERATRFYRTPATPVNYISVESVDESTKRARRLGAEELMPKTPVKGMGWFAWLKDTEGNVFGIWQTDEKAA
jgi:predicted enzyme related to lactoylglutathione lyase